MKNYRKNILRFFLVALLLLAWGEPGWERNAKRRSVIFVLDVSQSVALIHEAAGRPLLDFYTQKIQAYLSQQKDDPRFAVVFFAAGVQLALAWQEGADPFPLPKPHIPTEESRLDEALAFALSYFPQDVSREVVLFTDGQIPKAILAKAREIVEENALRVLVFSALPEKAAAFTDVCLPDMILAPKVAQNAFASGFVVIRSTHPGAFEVTLTSQGKICEKRIFQLDQKGVGRLYFSIPARETGRHSVQADVQSLSWKDAYAGNNHQSASFQVAQESATLLVGKPLPWDLPGATYEAPEDFVQKKSWNRFSRVVLQEGKASLLTPILEELREYVFRGGSLLVMGHATTLGPGGYHKTPLEKALPVSCLPENKKKLALLVILDISGSMDEKEQGKSKLDSAKEALRSLLPSLTATDLFSLLAFRDEALRLLPFSSWDAATLEKTLQGLHARGFTHLLAPLEMALSDFALVPTDATRHILILSDGVEGGKKEEILPWIEKMAQQNITISAVVAGPDPQGLIQAIVKKGKGRMYTPEDASFFSSLLTELSYLRRNLIAEGAFPLEAPPSRSSFIPPSYEGETLVKRIEVQTKSWGEVFLQTKEKAPVLVGGYYGLGRSAVFTSNFSPEWSHLPVDRARQLLFSILAWLTPPDRQPEIETEWQEGSLSLRLTFEDPIPQNVSLLVSENASPIPMKPISLRQYEATLPILSPGEYNLIFQEESSQKPLFLYPLSVSYAYEYQNFGERALSFPSFPAPGTQFFSLTPWILALALVLFLLERWLR